MTIQEAWDKRRKLWAESDKLWAEGDKLWAEGDKLRAEGNICFYDAVIAVHGNIEVKWESNDIVVAGVKYFMEPPAPCEGKL